MVNEHTQIQKQLKNTNGEKLNYLRKTSSNNSILSSKNLNKNYTLSCGCVGFNGAKRSSSQAAQVLGEAYGEYLQSQNVNDIIVVFNGIGKGREL